MLAMRLWKLATVMAPLQRQQRHPAGVLRAALLLLCLALLMPASVPFAFARPVPSEKGNGHDLDVFRQPEEGGIRSQKGYPPFVKSALPEGEANQDNLKECESPPDSTTESCGRDMDRRMLENYLDYGPPGQNRNNHPSGPLP